MRTAQSREVARSRGAGATGRGEPRLSFRIDHEKIARQGGGKRAAAGLLLRSQLRDVRLAAAVGVARQADVLEHRADRPVEVALPLEDRREALVRDGDGRVEPYRRAEVLLGAARVPAREQHAAEAAAGLRVVRVELDAALQRRVRRLARLARFAELRQADPEPPLDQLGVLLGGEAVRRDRLVPVLQLHESVGRGHASPAT